MRRRPPQIDVSSDERSGAFHAGRCEHRHLVAVGLEPAYLCFLWGVPGSLLQPLLPAEIKRKWNLMTFACKNGGEAVAGVLAVFMKSEWCGLCIHLEN